MVGALPSTMEFEGQVERQTCLQDILLPDEKLYDWQKRSRQLQEDSQQW